MVSGDRRSMGTPEELFQENIIKFPSGEFKTKSLGGALGAPAEQKRWQIYVKAVRCSKVVITMAML